MLGRGAGGLEGKILEKQALQGHCAQLPAFTDETRSQEAWRQGRESPRPPVRVPKEAEQGRCLPV